MKAQGFKIEYRKVDAGHSEMMPQFYPAYAIF